MWFQEATLTLPLIVVFGRAAEELGGGEAFHSSVQRRLHFHCRVTLKKSFTQITPRNDVLSFVCENIFDDRF